jgi:hypothetical protein
VAVEWTQADIDALKAAIANGVLLVTYNGPPYRQVQYQSLSEMRKLLASMNRQVSGAPNVRLATTSRGFRNG